ncbi:MAG: hypothetical protein WC679_11010 [Bacteroidales bacterium]
MKKLVFATICCSLLFMCNINAQSKYKMSFISSMNVGFFDNSGKANSDLKKIYPDFNDGSISQGSLNLGYNINFCKDYNVEVNLAYAIGNDKNKNQFKSLYGGSFNLYFGYTFLKKEKFELDANTGCKLSSDYFSYNRKNDDNTISSLNLSSINTFIPVGMTYWVTSKALETKSGAVGFRLTYNFLVARSDTKFSGLNVKTDIGCPASSSLWFGIIFKI